MDEAESSELLLFVVVVGVVVVGAVAVMGLLGVVELASS